MITTDKSRMTYLHQNTQRSCQQDCVHVSVILSQFPSACVGNHTIFPQALVCFRWKSSSYVGPKERDVPVQPSLIDFWQIRPNCFERVFSDDDIRFYLNSEIASYYWSSRDSCERNKDFPRVSSCSEDTFIALLSLRIDPACFCYCAHLISSRDFKEERSWESLRKLK